jgi:hypothetical protein
LLGRNELSSHLFRREVDRLIYGASEA